MAGTKVHMRGVLGVHSTRGAHSECEWCAWCAHGACSVRGGAWCGGANMGDMGWDLLKEHLDKLSRLLALDHRMLHKCIHALARIRPARQTQAPSLRFQRWLFI